MVKTQKPSLGKQAKKPSQAKPTAESIPSRPPVVVVMGHVDHGKTTLLDAIRSLGRSQKPQSLTVKEHGGITQHIGAYQVEVPLEEEPKARDDFASRKITFLDTPGHEAFAQMRSRGAKVADLAILVVAANDGVKPQTKEAISHIKASQIPMIVAINKIDLPEASVEMVKAQLAESQVFVEGYGGDVVSVPISAKTSQGVDHLLEMILLVAEMQSLTLDSRALLKAYVLETFLDPHRGVVVNLLVKEGQLKIGEEVVAKALEKEEEIVVSGKVKAMLGETGEPVNQALSGQPVQALGFKTMPLVGAQVTHGKIEIPETVQTQTVVNKTAVSSTEGEAEEKTQKLILILKADVQGSLEAIKANLTEEVVLVDEGIGDITESDVLLAASTKAQLIGFNVKVSGTVKKLAAMEKVKIKTYNVIYHLLEEIQQQVLKMLEPTIDEETLGEGEIIAEFKIKGSHIAGCKVTSGLIAKSNRVRIMRGEELVGEPKRIVSFQRERQEVTEVKKGNEVGIVFYPDVRFQIGDAIISYKRVND